MCIIIYKIRIRRGYKSKLNYLTKLIYYIVLCVRNSCKGVNVCVSVGLYVFRNYNLYKLPMY